MLSAVDMGQHEHSDQLQPRNPIHNNALCVLIIFYQKTTSEVQYSSFSVCLRTLVSITLCHFDGCPSLDYFWSLLLTRTTQQDLQFSKYHRNLAQSLISLILSIFPTSTSLPITPITSYPLTGAIVTR